jgi:hypothetical protein
LLLLAADVAEHDFDDRKRALELHRRAEEMQPQSLGVLSGIARLAREQGDVAECDRVAGLLKLAAAEARNVDAAADALYLAAELELARPDSRGAGIATLSDALGKRPDEALLAVSPAESGIGLVLSEVHARAAQLEEKE